MSKREPQPDRNERCQCGHKRWQHETFGYCYACHETHDHAFCQQCHEQMRSHGFKPLHPLAEVAAEQKPPAADHKSLSANPEDP